MRYPLHYRILQALVFPTPIPNMDPSELQRVNRRGLPDTSLTRKLFRDPGRSVKRVPVSIPGEEAVVSGTAFIPLLKSDQENRPAILFFHGGGWVLANSLMHDIFCARLAGKLGVSVFSVNYRLAPKNRFPAAFHDACSALQWIRQQQQFPVDVSRIYVMGGSAGGNLAAVLALAERDNHNSRFTDVPRIRGQILIYPVTDCRRESPSYREHANAPFLRAADMEFFINSYIGSEDDINNPYCSPLLHPDHSDLPPALIIGAELDPLRDDGIRYAEALFECGVPVQYHLCRRAIHGFISIPGNRDTEALIEQIVRFYHNLEEIDTKA